MSNGGSRSDGMRDVSHLHNDTCSSVNSAGWTGCQRKDFLSGDHGEFYRWTSPYDVNVAAAVDKSLLQCNAFEGSYPSLPRSLPLLPLSPPPLIVVLA